MKECPKEEIWEMGYYGVTLGKKNIIIPMHTHSGKRGITIVPNNTKAKKLTTQVLLGCTLGGKQYGYANAASKLLFE